MPEAIAVRGTIVTPREFIQNGHVVVESGKITHVGSGVSSSAGRVLDYGDCLVAPGFIDLHVHGGGGHDVMGASIEGLNGLSRFLAAGGVTSLLATAYSASQEDILAATKTVAKAVKEGLEGSEILGLHIEGPYVNPKMAGALSVAHVRPPSIDELEEIYRAAGGALGIVTLAPEMEGAIEAVAWLRSKGVIPSAGHTDATHAEMMAAVEAGLSHAAHLFNRMRPFHHREPGAVGAALADDRVSVELIADGVHLHPSTLRLAARAKGPGRIALVSDVIFAAGLPDGEYQLGAEQIRVQGGRSLLESGALAGSTIRLCDAVRYAVETASLPVTEAIEMASSTPARIIGMAEKKGRLAPGMDADLTVLGRDYEVLLTMVGGGVVYERGKCTP
ncbi:MAG: N-acetylglucosamine-6-phosphate deacetylase [Candidatus Bathyarchaeota archaeon]|nr:N-acetylglucosamine-6-phosphate deacetylase [Candidatus Bathyarchaeota archaeon]